MKKDTRFILEMMLLILFIMLAFQYNVTTHCIEIYTLAPFLKIKERKTVTF